METAQQKYQTSIEETWTSNFGCSNRAPSNHHIPVVVGYPNGEVSHIGNGASYPVAAYPGPDSGFLKPIGQDQSEAATEDVCHKHTR